MKATAFNWATECPDLAYNVSDLARWRALHPLTESDLQTLRYLVIQEFLDVPRLSHERVKLSRIEAVLTEAILDSDRHPAP